MRYTGTITKWQDEKGFGFITPEEGGKSIFVHISAFTYTKRRPVEGDRITYALSTDERGRPCAQNVTFVEERVVLPTTNKGILPAAILAVAFFLFLGGAVLSQRLPLFVLVVYLVISFLTFLIYGQDKNAAQTSQWRTAESALHLLELLGGWPGALVAQQVLRHKTRKESFQVVFWMMVVFNCITLGCLLTEEGSRLLRSLSGVEK